LVIDIPSGYGNAFRAKRDAFPECREVRPMWQHAQQERKECVSETVSGPKGAEEEGVIEPTQLSACTRSWGPVGSERSRLEH
jgi:hypothetical protein